MDGKSQDISNEQKQKLRELFPEVFSENKIDWDKLKATLGQDVDLGERYNLSWKGKSNVFRAIQEQTTKTLKPVPEESVNWDTTQNLFIEGDNLDALKVLHKAYYGKVKMIYIDPPYNTGNDFVYKDKFAQTQAEYESEAGLRDEAGNLKRTDGLRKNSKDGGHFHSNWLNMMYPRLYLARNFLRNDGVIFVSIDDNEVHNLRMIMNEIFSEESFIAQLPRITKKAGKSGNEFSKNHDYVLVYSRANQHTLKRYPHTDSGFKYTDKWVETRGKYKLNQTLDYDTLGYVESLDYPIIIDGKTFYAGSVSQKDFNVRKLEDPKDGYRWRWSENKFKFGYANDFVVVSKSGRIYTKTYENCYIEKVENKYIIVYGQRTKALTTLDLLQNKYSNDNAKKDLKKIFPYAVFDYTKPIELIKALTYISTDENDIVLDFFAGSGTTAHAVEELNFTDGKNRNWILIQLPEETNVKSSAYIAGFKTVSEVTRERLRRAFNIVFDNKPGYKSLKITGSNFKNWNSDVKEVSDLNQQLIDNTNPIIESASEQDILGEILLKNGIMPSEHIEHRSNYYFLGSSNLAISLNKELTQEIFATILADKPEKLIIFDSSLKNNDQLKANLLLQAEQNQINIEVV